MKWIGISGSWRKTNNKIERDVRRVVRRILLHGDGIVSGGALNVDFFATDEAMQIDPTGTYIKIFLPTTLDIYAKHYRKRAYEKVITSKQAEELINQLTRLQQINPKALIESRQNRTVDIEAYFKRNSAVINAADELIAFQVNKSNGVQDTIEKAKAKGIPVKLFTYTLD